MPSTTFRPSTQYTLPAQGSYQVLPQVAYFEAANGALLSASINSWLTSLHSAPTGNYFIDATHYAIAPIGVDRFTALVHYTQIERV